MPKTDVIKRKKFVRAYSVCVCVCVVSGALPKSFLKMQISEQSTQESLKKMVSKNA